MWKWEAIRPMQSVHVPGFRCGAVYGTNSHRPLHPPPELTPRLIDPSGYRDRSGFEGNPQRASFFSWLSPLSWPRTPWPLGLWEFPAMGQEFYWMACHLFTWKKASQNVEPSLPTILPLPRMVFEILPTGGGSHVSSSMWLVLRMFGKIFFEIEVVASHGVSQRDVHLMVFACPRSLFKPPCSLESIWPAGSLQLYCDRWFSRNRNPWPRFRCGMRRDWSGVWKKWLYFNHFSVRYFIIVITSPLCPLQRSGF